jgi:hypothetical protein
MALVAVQLVSHRAVVDMLHRFVPVFSLYLQNRLAVWKYLCTNRGKGQAKSWLANISIHQLWYFFHTERTEYMP